jgi:two-component system, chemotaxis family, CheB/CheR fusion protein
MMIQTLTTGRTNQSSPQTPEWTVDEFLAMVSHELRNPITAILGWADVISMNTVDNETCAHAVEVIKRSALLEAKLINQLMDFSRTRNGVLMFSMQTVDLAATLKAAIETMTPPAKAKAIEWRIDVERSPVLLLGDGTRLQQVLTNLLSNAIKFTPHGGRVEVELETVGKRAKITVGDTGCGISAEFLPYVFDRFRQQVVDRTQGAGLGLGLAITQYLVEEHGGDIFAKSDGDGQGSTFTVYLPLKPNAAKTNLASDDER